MKHVGILVDDHVFRGIKRRKTGQEKLDLYNRAAKRHKLTPVYMSLERINPASGTAFGYTYGKDGYRLKKVKIPRVIHNRAMAGTKRRQAALKKLQRISYVFNGKNRYSKYRIHRLLKIRFGSHLPRTVSYSKANLDRMMNKHSCLYVKPQSGSIGNGIMRLTRKKEGKAWGLRMPSRQLVVPRSAARAVVHRVARIKPYLIQEGIPLARYAGRPYDIRVSVQRGSGGRWQLTGMVGKVARKGSHVTNVAKGGTVKRCEALLKNSVNNPSRAAASVRRLSLAIAAFLGKKLNKLADAGLDIGVDASGKPYFIELNCRDQRYSFRKAGMYDTFYRTYENPIRYAKYKLR